MNPLTYLGFTIFSIIMQFCVMEFIQETFLTDNDTASFNESLIGNDNDLIKNINRKPHALFYRTERNAEIDSEKNKNENSIIYKLEEDITSTDSSSTYEIFYENTSFAEDFFTTEYYFTSSEFDNVTDVTFIDKSNTTTKQNRTKKVTSKGKCLCNLLYQQCDVNCCCDTDCTEEERNLFLNCGKDSRDRAKGSMYSCNNYATYHNMYSTDAFNELFCIVKVNIPGTRVKSHTKMDVLNATYKWNDIEAPDISISYKRAKYEYGDPVFLLQNNATLTFTLPTPVTNNYCNGNKPLKFLTNENIKCNFKIRDSYMTLALKAIEGTKLISFNELYANSTVLNCTTLHCVNWTICVCNENICVDYNKTIHTPSCTDNYCNNIAHKMDFTFYYFDSKIINASLQLHMTKVQTSLQLLTQEITVKWYIGNESISDIIQLSGNPGYIPGMPLIVSFASNNHSSHFFNRTQGIHTLTLPQNINGQCDWIKGKNKTLLFGLNTRSKCRLNIFQDVSSKNATAACQDIQANIKEHLRINRVLFVSPYGNPQDVIDEKWILLEIFDRTFIYGEYSSKNSKFVCYNLMTRYKFVVAYADVSEAVNWEENKIVKATVAATQSNVTFDTTRISTILSIDIRFIDVSKPLIEFAKAPDLNIHLPANFFFGNPLSNRNQRVAANIVLVPIALYLVLLYFYIIKK